MDSKTWEMIRKTGQGNAVLSEAKLSPALVQLRWASLTKSDRDKIESVSKWKGWYEEKAPIVTKKGVEKKAPEHHRVAVRKSLEQTLRKPLEHVPEPKEPERVIPPVEPVETVSREPEPKPAPEPEPELFYALQSKAKGSDNWVPERTVGVKTLAQEYAAGIEKGGRDARIIEKEGDKQHIIYTTPPTPAPAPVSVPVPVPVKELAKPKEPVKYPYQMTQKEYIDFRTLHTGAFDPSYKNFHESHVMDALESGKIVTDTVLQDYPYLYDYPSKIPLIKAIKKNMTLPEPSNLKYLEVLDLTVLVDYLDRSQWHKFDISTDTEALNRVNNLLKTSHIVHIDDLDKVKAVFYGEVKVQKPVAREVEHVPVPVQIPEERKVPKAHQYEEKIRVTLESLGTIVASEWKATGYYQTKPEQMENCQLCGHGIQNVYILTKIAGANAGKSLKVGSECVVNYLGIPINKIEFDLKFNQDGKFKERIAHVQENIGKLASPANKDYQSRNFWSDKKTIIDTYVNEITAQDFLTEGKAEKVIEYHTKSEEELNRVKVTMDEAEKERDSLKQIMEESIPFHSGSKFIRSIYMQWKSGGVLSEKQKSSFIDAVTRMKATASSTEPFGKNTVKGIIKNFREGYVNTGRGSKQKLTFDVGNVSQISVVEWIKGFEDIKNIRNSGKELDVEVTYNYDGRYRNMVVNGIATQAKIQTLPDAPEMDIDLSRFLPIKPRAWQMDCFRRWWIKGEGIIKAGTGAGKTTFGVMCQKYLLHENFNLTVLISVPTVVLQKQWRDEMIKNGIDASVISYVGGEGGQEITTQIVIAIINSLRNRELLDIYGKPFDLFIGDEAHHLSTDAEQNATIIENNEFGRMLLFSATPGETLEAKYPTTCIVTERELLDEGSLCNYTVTNIGIDLPSSDMAQYEEYTARAIRAGGMDTDGGKMWYGRRSRFLQNHATKVNSAIELVKELQYDKAIVFFSMINAVEAFNEMMHSMGVPSVIYHSKMSDEQKAQNLAKFASGGAKMLIGAFAIGEGLNIPSADTMILVGGSSKSREFIQRSGRVKRASAGKELAQIFQIYARGTVEESYVQNRLDTVPEGIKIINK